MDRETRHDIYNALTLWKPTVKLPGESAMARSLARYFIAKHWLSVRIETGATIVGFPDMLAITNRGDTVYIELKCNTAVSMNLSAAQRQFLNTLASKGAPVFVIHLHPKRREVTVIPGGEI